jgi:signal transduction histidine kinase
VNRTGLGLAVAQGILEQHAGEITVHSTPGVGTEFQVALPVTVAVPSGVSK